MNEIISASADAAVRYLLVGSVAAVILVPLAWLIIRTARLRAPVYRHTIWFYCLLATVAFPAIWLHGPKLLLPVLPARTQVSEAPAPLQSPPQRVQASGVPALPQTRLETAVASTQEPSAAPIQNVSSSQPTSHLAAVSWRVTVAGAWLVGFGIMLIRLAIAWQRLRNICRSATPIEPGELAEDLSSRRLAIRLTEHLQGPVCFGVLHPVILLPRQMYQDASSKDLRMVLTHELAHIDRRDCWVNLFQRLLEAVFFFHSLVWLASRQLTHERERICDNWVLARGVCVDDYMQLLSDIGERILMKTGHLPSVALFEGGLLSRVRSLLDPQHSRITRMTRRSAWMCTLSFLLCFAALGTVRLGARPNPGDSIDPGDATFHPQEESLGSSGRRPTGECSLSGQVVSEQTEEPVGHARVHLFSIATHDSIFIRVASDGSFVFKDIPAGDYHLQVSNTAGYQDVVYNPEDKARNFPVFTLKSNEQRTGVVLQIKPACKISGTVFDESGSPLTGKEELWVVAWQEKDNIDSLGTRFTIAAQTPTYVQANGSYMLDGLDALPTYVMVIDWRAQNKDSPYPPCYYPGTVDRNKATLVSFDSTGIAENVDIRLQKHGEYTLEGTVTDESTSSPIEKALVVVHHTDMLFDCVTTYTDAQGHYRIDSLGPGEFLVHVDAKPFGFVRNRQPLTIREDAKENPLDFSLRPGVTISGKFVDADGKEVEFDDPSYGYAHHQPELNPQPGSWSGRSNRYGVAERKGSTSFTGGAGDYEDEHLDFPTRSTFIVEGVLPGQTFLSFEPKTSDAFVQAILLQGRNIMATGFDTGGDREIRDVTIVIGHPIPPLAPR